MESESSSRVWRVCRAAGRPFPVLSDDDVIDYMIMEAVQIKVGLEDEKLRKEAEKKAARDNWKKDTSNLEQFR